MERKGGRIDSFIKAYLVSASAPVGLITAYSASIFKNFRLNVVVFSCLVSLYAFLYTLVSLQDYSLLMGSIGLFVIMGLIMYLSRNLNWFNQISSEI